jgi:hypothetical protein
LISSLIQRASEVVDWSGMMIGLMVMVAETNWVVAKDRRRISHAPLGDIRKTYLD